MDVIFSNKGGQYTNEEIIDAAVAHNVKAIELLVDRKKLLELEGLEGDKELRYFKTKLPESGLKLHGFCYYTDFNLLEDIMLAKKCVNLLNRLEGKVLRLIFKTIPGNMVMEKTYTTIETFLNSLARFASYSAGGGKGETVVRIAFDIFTQPNFGFNDFLKINRALQDSRNVGIAVDLGNFAKIDEIKKVIKQINGYEFTLNHVSVNDRLEEKLVKD
ncbi:MAG: TIM barrel protein, partial [Clostridiaceae bacterium]|nr:TIM barrel protein [Clostridiaceae bacterium]